MPTPQYVGKAGHLAVMGEFSFRGYNIAMPEIDIGDDVFVVNDLTGTMWRLQVKTSTGRLQARSSAYQFRIRETAIQHVQNPDLHFVFVMRQLGRWRFLVLPRIVLRNYVINNNLGTLNNLHRQISVTLHEDGRAICSNVSLINHLEDWHPWPILGGPAGP